MKDLIRQYLDNGMSRRQLMTGLSALGMSTVAARSVAQSLETFGQGAAPPRAAMREMKGTGGALFVAPYYLSALPDRLPPGSDLERFRIAPDNARYGSDRYFRSIRSVMVQ